MCISLAALAGIASAAAPIISAVGGGLGIVNAIKGLTSKGPAPGPSAAEQQAAVDAKATQSSNARLAARRKALSANSLVTGGTGDVMSTGILNGGRATLGR